MTAADGRATDAALGQSGTATPATPRRAAPHGQPSRMSRAPGRAVGFGGRCGRWCGRGQAGGPALGVGGRARRWARPVG